MDFQIDCQTFLRLTGESLGRTRSELYVIGKDGVRLWRDGVDTGELAERWGGSHTDAFLLDLADTARLPFPTTAIVLAAWQRENTEFALPSWLHQVVNAEDSFSAIAKLDHAALEYKALQDAAARKLAKLKMVNRKPSSWYPVEVEWNRLLDMHHVIVKIHAELISAAPINATAKPAKVFSSHQQVSSLGGIGKRDRSPKQKAKELALELWKERQAGKHPELGTVTQFATEVMRRWPVLMSQKVIEDWSAKWSKATREGRAPVC